MKNKWSFYGSDEPKAFVGISWLLFFALPVVTFFSVRFDNGHQAIFAYSILSGIAILASAIKLRSWLLVILGFFTLTFYAYIATLLLGVIP